MDDDTRQLKLVILESEFIPAAQYAEIVALCNRAFDEDLESLFKSYSRATHILGYVNERLVSHAQWVTRWLSCNNGPLLRTAFVEMVATDRQSQNQGFATRLMERLAVEIMSFELGALWPNYPAWYARLGWVNWRGPLFIRGREGLIATPEDHIMVKLLPGTPVLDLDTPLSADWRAGELW